MPLLQPSSQGAYKIHPRSADIRDAATLAVHGRPVARWCRWLAPTVLHSAAAEYAYRVSPLCRRSVDGCPCASILRNRSALLRSRHSCLSARILCRLLASVTAGFGNLLCETVLAFVRGCFRARFGASILFCATRNAPGDWRVVSSVGVSVSDSGLLRHLVLVFSRLQACQEHLCRRSQDLTKRSTRPPSRHVYEVRPRKDHRGFDLTSDALPSGGLWYLSVPYAIGYAKHYCRAHDAVISVYDAAGKLIEVHRHKGDFKEPSGRCFRQATRELSVVLTISAIPYRFPAMLMRLKTL